jgi:hypothetical protein
VFFHPVRPLTELLRLSANGCYSPAPHENRLSPGITGIERNDIGIDNGDVVSP